MHAVLAGRIYIYIYICKHTFVYIYMCTYMYIYIYIHIFVCVCSQPFVVGGAGDGDACGARVARERLESEDS